jgi:hypothetical protein
MNPSICRTLSTICFQGGMLSILLSIWIWWFLNGDSPEEQAHAERFGIFVGLWGAHVADPLQPLRPLR